MLKVHRASAPREEIVLYYLIGANTRDARGEVLLNDIPVWDAQENTSGMSQINPWLVAGQNRLLVRVARRGNCPRCEVRLCRGREGELPGDLASVALGDDLPAGEPAVVWEHPFTPEQAPGPWSWERARPTALPADRAAIVALVGRIHEALARRDIDAVHAAQRLSFDENARAMGYDPAKIERMRQRTNAQMKDYLAASRIHPFDPSSLQLRAMAGGRLVRVTEAGGKGPIGGAGPDDGAFALTMDVSCIDGDWAIARGGVTFS